jgi:hypothetical protein
MGSALRKPARSTGSTVLLHIWIATAGPPAAANSPATAVWRVDALYAARTCAAASSDMSASSKRAASTNMAWLHVSGTTQAGRCFHEPLLGGRRHGRRSYRKQWSQPATRGLRLSGQPVRPRIWRPMVSKGAIPFLRMNARQQNY